MDCSRSINYPAEKGVLTKLNGAMNRPTEEKFKQFYHPKQKRVGLFYYLMGAAKMKRHRKIEKRLKR